MDYHGIFQEEKDMWGGNDYWPTHPYNRSQGGPCAKQNDFFTDPDARKLYVKRLRYMVARYGAWPSLLSWEFFNEINNVYHKLDRADVVRWHGDMADTLHGLDPFHHPVTTSFGSQIEDREMWAVPSLDFTQFHLYCDGIRSGLGLYIADTSRRFSGRYGRPLVYSEFGATYKNNGRALDPNDRCLRQGLWTGLLSGSAGTVMPWWWEGLRENNRYSLWRSLSGFIKDTGFGGASWHPAETETPPPPPPDTAPLAPEPGAAPFTVELSLDAGWNDRPAGDLTLRGPEDADAPPLPSFLHGSSHEMLRRPFTLKALFAENAAVRVQIDAVSNGTRVGLRVDGNTVLEQEIPNKDGKSEVNGEYPDLFLEIPVPAGEHTVELVNTGLDWAHICSVRLSGALPAQGRDTSLGADAFAMTDGKVALAYLVDRRYEYPNGRGAKTPRSCDTTLTLRGLADGAYAVTWWDPAGGTETATIRGECQNGTLQLTAPAFKVDTAARIAPEKTP